MTNPELFPDLPAPIAQALARRGFTELTPVQRAVVEAEHEGRDLRISSQTGSGKTVAIGLALAAHFLDPSPVRTGAEAGDAAGVPGPAATPAPTAKAPKGPRSSRAPGDPAAHPRALVVVPTRELAAQVREELKWLFSELPGATVEVVTGGTSILRERIALSRRPAFVVGTPGRLLDHMRNGALACDAIEHVILDEADQMLDMGFKDELDAILEQLPEKRSSHLVSATFPQAVKSLANRFQKNALTLEGTKLGLANPDIEHVAYTIRRHETYAALVNVLLLTGDSRCLLFVNRRVDATELAEKLTADGFGAAPFSGELPQAQRTRTLAAFRNGILPILVSTDVAARGIDVPEISTVIHVDPPRNPDAYVHRSGRTGRAGRTGRSILLVEGNEARKVGRMLSATRVAVAWQRVPTREDVERFLDQQGQRILAARLDEAAPTESQRMAAKQLLIERDPIEIVASLLELAKPTPPRAPMAVQGLDPFFDDGRGHRGQKTRDARPLPGVRKGREERVVRGERPQRVERSERADRADRGRPAARVEWPKREEPKTRVAGAEGVVGSPAIAAAVTTERSEQATPFVPAERPMSAPRAERPAAGAFTPFMVTWGERAGATTARLLSHVCRRGELASDQIGAIRVFAKSSIVEVSNAAAEAFEARTRNPDERDPGIMIERARSESPERPRPQAYGAQSGPRHRPAGNDAPRSFDRREGAKPPFKARRAAGTGGAYGAGTGGGAHSRFRHDRVPGETGPAPYRDRKGSPKHVRASKPGEAVPPAARRTFKGPVEAGSESRAGRGPDSGFDPSRRAPGSREPGKRGPGKAGPARSGPGKAGPGKRDSGKRGPGTKGPRKSGPKKAGGGPRAKGPRKSGPGGPR